MIYDSHCHLDLLNNMMDIIHQIQNTDIGLFAVGTTPRAYSREIQLCKNVKNIHVGLGMHPQLVSSDYADMQLFKRLLKESHYIGEVGLDFSKEYIHTKESQIKVFREIVKLCEQYGEKVVSIHSLKSAGDVIDILKEYKHQRNNKYIFHWFTGSVSQLIRAIELDCYFSINPSMLRTKSGIEIIKNVPINRLLLETDIPFADKIHHIEEIQIKFYEMIAVISDIVKIDILNRLDKNIKDVFKY